jgi:hypothetical protein
MFFSKSDLEELTAPAQHNSPRSRANHEMATIEIGSNAEGAQISHGIVRTTASRTYPLGVRSPA